MAKNLIILITTFSIGIIGLYVSEHTYQQKPREYKKPTVQLDVSKLAKDFLNKNYLIKFRQDITLPSGQNEIQTTFNKLICTIFYSFDSNRPHIIKRGTPLHVKDHKNEDEVLSLIVETENENEFKINLKSSEPMRMEDVLAIFDVLPKEPIVAD